MNRKPIHRRKLLKALPVGMAAGIAGCLGGDDDGGDDDGGSDDGGSDDGGSDDGGSDDTTPTFTNDTASLWVHNSPGGSQDFYGRVWSGNLDRYYPEGVSVTLEHHVGADGLLQANRFEDLDDANEVLATFRQNTLIANAYADEARFDLNNFQAINWMYPSTRGIQISHDHEDVEDHWDWDWDTFVDRAPDMKFAGTGPHQLIFTNALEEFEPRFSPGDLEVVLFDGGSDARAALLRGDVTGYLGGYSSNIAPGRTDFYKTQFVVGDESNPELVEDIRTVNEDAVITGDVMPEEGAQRLTDIVVDPTGAFVRSDIDDDYYDVHLEAIEQAGVDETLHNQVIDNQGILTLNHSTMSGQEAKEAFESKVALLEEYPNIIPDL